MKGCPRCKSLVFDDMDTCFGCMYRFDISPQPSCVGDKVDIDRGLPSSMEADASAVDGRSNRKRRMPIIFDDRLPDIFDDRAPDIFDDWLPDMLIGCMPEVPADRGSHKTVDGLQDAGADKAVGTLSTVGADREAKKSYRLAAGGSISIGRSSRNDIVLNAPNVSRRHARVEEIRNRVWITDLESVNSTKVNGRVVDGKCELLDKDIIDICGNRFLFEC